MQEIDPKKKSTEKIKLKNKEIATRKDSLDVYNSSKERNEAYRKSGYTEDAPKKFDKSKQNQNVNDEAGYNSVNALKDKKAINVTRGGVTNKEALDPKEYAEKIDKYKYKQRDNVTADVNMDVPMGRKDSRMQPKETIVFRKGTDIASVDQYQDPTTVKKNVVKNTSTSGPKKEVIKRKAPIQAKQTIIKSGNPNYLTKL
jgi:hypothetical protein